MVSLCGDFKFLAHLLSMFVMEMDFLEDYRVVLICK